MNTKLSIFCTKIIEAGWLAAIIAVPVFFNIHSARTFEPDKITLLRSLAIVMILAWLIKIIEEGAAIQHDQPYGERLKQWLKRPLILPTLILVIVYIVSTILSISPNVSLWGSYQRLQGTYTTFSYIIIFAMMASTMNTRAQIDRFVSAAILASVPVALYGVIQRNGLDPLPWQGDVTRRVASNMGNAIFVASYLIMIIPLTISRLIKSMTAIVTEENASWGQTVLSAVYIFVLAIQILTVLYSGSRGPQIGLLGAFALMGLLYLLIFRQKDEDRTTVAIKEVGLSVGLVAAVGVGAAVAGGLGYLGGLGIDALLNQLNLAAEGIPLLGAALGGAIGFAGVYTAMAATQRGWRWLWISWIVIGALAIGFVLTLNIPEGPLQPLREVPYLGRLGQLTDTQEGTGKVRVLIWEGALNLISPHRPLGIEGEFTDNLNGIRTVFGYGPESMFNAFAYSYPTELAHIEARGSSADRSHNETMDSFVITGVVGFAAFYLLMGSIFYFLLRWQGWVPHKRAGYWLIGLMTVFGLLGTFIPYGVTGNFTLSPVGLPFGLFAAIFAYLTIRGFIKQPALSEQIIAQRPLLLIGIFGALIGHFLEVHFVFSIAATYTYFWAYLGLAYAIFNMQPVAETSLEEAESETPETQPTANSKRRRKGRRTASRRVATSSGGFTADGWEVWVGSQGLVMAIILTILIFDFVPVNFDLSTGRYSLLWMSTITFLVGLAITLSEIAINRVQWRKLVNWAWGLIIYLVTSLGYTSFYILVHAQLRDSVQRLAIATNNAIQALNQSQNPALAMPNAIQAAVEGANSVVNLFIGFYVVLIILLLLIAAMLTQGNTKRMVGWRRSNWWLYPPLILATVLVISFKNIDVIKSDILLKDGNKYKDANLWDMAIGVHQEGVNADSDEDFYYLMLALDYQLKAQDNRQPPEVREQAWKRGEEIALRARDLNKYNPDNTGNMGRYYFTIAQIFDASYYAKAMDFFEKAAALAPQNVDYYNLVAQVHYANGDFEQALSWLDQSVSLDDQYAPTWLFKGDAHAAKQEPDEAIAAHKEAILLDANSFIDGNFDTRVNFYASLNRTEELIETLQAYADQQVGDSERIQNNRNRALWAIGHTHLRLGNTDEANRYLEMAINNGYDNPQAFVEAGDTYLAQQQFNNAEIAYQRALEKNNNLPQVYSSLGYIYAQTGRPQEAIQANLKVLEALPNDYDSNKNLALLYQQQGQPEQALAHAQIALEAAPEASKNDLQLFINQVSTELEAGEEPADSSGN